VAKPDFRNSNSRPQNQFVFRKKLFAGYTGSGGGGRGKPWTGDGAQGLTAGKAGIWPGRKEKPAGSSSRSLHWGVSTQPGGPG